ncbi:MAG: hypothetical protein RLZZ450_7305 [Pseudomonadota bacterium]|jgi:hypothetical protein
MTRHAWQRQLCLSRWERGLARAARKPAEAPTGSTLPGSEQLQLMELGLRLCGLLGATALLRVEVDNDNDVVLRDLDGVPVAMVRPLSDGSLVRVF